MASEVRLGLLGCGLVALAVHAVNVRRLPGVVLAGAWDDDPRKLQRIRSIAPATQLYDQLDDLLTEPIDGVLIATPYEQHAATAIRAFEAGKHVYVEKPFATTLADAQAAEAAWRRSGRIGMVGFNYRFNPLFNRLRDAIRAGSIGKVASLRTSFSFSPHGGQDWDLTRHGEHGALFDLAPHHLDLARHLTGAEPTSITALVRNGRSPRDIGHLEIAMDDGALVQSRLQLNSVEEHRIEAYGEAGKLSVDLTRSLALQRVGLRATALGGAVARVAQAMQPLTHAGYLAEKLRAPWREPSFLRAIASFTEAIRTGARVSPDFADGLACHRMLEAALTSAASGAAVEVSR